MMNKYIHKCESFEVKIFLGLKNSKTLKTIGFNLVGEYINDFIRQSDGLCVTLTKTQYFYNNGYEDGLIIGLINYPRFPKQNRFIKDKALELAKFLKKKCKQKRISIQFPDETVMLGSLS